MTRGGGPWAASPRGKPMACNGAKQVLRSGYPALLEDSGQVLIEAWIEVDVDLLSFQIEGTHDISHLTA